MKAIIINKFTIINMENKIIWTLLEWKWSGGTGPGIFSWFHIIWLVFCIGLSFCLIYFFARKHRYKYEVMICRIFAVVLLCLEILKLVTYSLYLGFFPHEGIPFDFCSIPIYSLAIASFINDYDSKLRDYLLRFSAFFGLVGGLAVMVYPAATLDTPYVYYSIHTMLWHSLLLSFSLFYFVSMDIGESIKKDIMPLSIGFIGVTGIAILINELGYKYYYLPIGKARSDRIICFWIAKHFDTEFPLLSIIKKNAPFPVSILSFIIIVLIIFTIIYYITKLIKYRTFKELDSKYYRNQLLKLNKKVK